MKTFVSGQTNTGIGDKMTIDPNLLTVILGLITNGLTSLLSTTGQKIGKLIVGKEFLEKWELEKTALLPILQNSISQLEEHIDLKEIKGEEIICLFLLSPEVEEIVRQIYSLRIINDNSYQTNLQKLYKVFKLIFINFIESYRSEIAPESEWIENNSNLLLDSLVKSCNLALNMAIDKGILAAHEAQSNFRHNIIISEIRAIQKKLDFLVSQKQLDIQAIQEFEKKYRQQVIERHNHIVPPDFDTARQIPIDDLYVYPNFANVSRTEETQKSLQVNTFLASLNRAVLLGTPGGGKSTFTTKLCHDFAINNSQLSLGGRQALTPILVVLRNYGVEKKERRCSILEFIETEAEGTYQLTTPPEGTFEYLLLNGKAFVIFDGLDELLDTGFRQEIRDDVQSFCNLYPSVPVLVTSREVGYEQAPLNEQLFEAFHLEPFDHNQVKEYAQKWFKIADINTPYKKRQQKIDNFLVESEDVSDLRSNPLMLALMCNIYRGENYIPKNRPEVYEKCATMLFERWDRSRNIRFSLPFEAHIRPAMMYIAHWIYSNDELRAGVTERLLIAKASEYLLKKRFEDPDEAETAANEFIEFCRGRAWIFTDTGTEKSGERLYQFTHQTFLEYFTAGYLVRTHPTPETIMNILLPRIAKREWDVVAQLAFQIQNRSSEDAGDKLLLMLIEYADKAEDAEKLNVLAFAGRCLNFMIPSPKVIREITDKCLKFMFNVGELIIHDKIEADDRIDRDVFKPLLKAAAENCNTIADEFENIFTVAIKGEDEVLAWMALDICLSYTEM